MQLTDIETPALVVDRSRLAHNIERMRRRLAELGVPLRPHVKTAKSADIVRLAVEGQPGGITVSTLREAEHFLEAGFTDILYAVGIAPSKLAHVAALQRRGADLTIILDSVEMAEAAAREAEALGTVFPVLIELDTDGGRAGVAAGDGPRLVEIGRILDAAPGTDLRGVMTHAGLSYGCRSPEALRAHAEQERSGAVGAAEALRAAGLAAPVVSIGSTPGALFAERLDGVTEVRAGVYMFMDLVMADLGVCAEEEIALSVLATVIGHRPDRGYLLLDAGGLALSKDAGPARDKPSYGSLWDSATGLPLGLGIASTNQEHGLVPAGEADLARLPIGSQVRIAPNHACMTAAAHDRYHVVEGGTEVRAVWERCNGW
ncbi:MAG TPA: alanine racemase [Allosphingosinicella sp.]|jgi:D-serine deaminase-like pyridoxal phosphate-dependent protein|nr:alanine racemase [Allosphingosinicella sp.]